MAEQGESCASVHLPLEHLRAGVHTLGPAVMARRGERGDDGIAVLLDPADEGVHVRQVRRTCGMDPLFEPGGICLNGLQEGGKCSHQAVQGGDLGAREGDLAKALLLTGGELVRRTQ